MILQLLLRNMEIHFGFVILGCFCTCANSLKATDWTNGMYPGTKWCGAGKTATSYNDLGTLDKVDACCRAHDKCPQFLGAWESGFGVSNNWYHSRGACSCENHFKDCLNAVSGAQKTDADQLGIIYFHLLHPKCFKPISVWKCAKKIWGLCVWWKTVTVNGWVEGIYYVPPSIWQHIKHLF